MRVSEALRMSSPIAFMRRAAGVQVGQGHEPDQAAVVARDQHVAQVARVISVDAS